MTDAAAALSKKPDRPAKNVVHEQRILVETIRKELREQKIYQGFTINPYTKSKYIILFLRDYYFMLFI